MMHVLSTASLSQSSLNSFRVYKNSSFFTLLTTTPAWVMHYLLQHLPQPVNKVHYTDLLVWLPQLPRAGTPMSNVVNHAFQSCRFDPDSCPIRQLDQSFLLAERVTHTAARRSCSFSSATSSSMQGFSEDALILPLMPVLTWSTTEPALALSRLL